MPPGAFIAGVVKLAMVGAAEGDADIPSQDETESARRACQPGCALSTSFMILLCAIFRRPCDLSNNWTQLSTTQFKRKANGLQMLRPGQERRPVTPPQSSDET
jgi:hypothetical protein